MLSNYILPGCYSYLEYRFSQNATVIFYFRFKYDAMCILEVSQWFIKSLLLISYMTSLKFLPLHV